MKPEKAKAYQIEIYRRMTGNQKLEIAFQLYEMVRNINRQHIQAENPELSPDEVERFLSKRMLKDGSARGL